jgi:hypothetical protein
MLPTTPFANGSSPAHGKRGQAAGKDVAPVQAWVPGHHYTFDVTSTASASRPRGHAGDTPDGAAH